MIRAAQERAIRKRYKEVAPVLDEQGRRRFVALEAQALGRGGVSLMARITGLACSTIYHGLSDIRERASAPPGRIRKEGASAQAEDSTESKPGAVAGLVGNESVVVSGLENPNDSGVEAPVETTPWKALPRSLRSRIREMERAPSFLRTGSIRSNQRYAIKSGNSSKA